MKVTTEDESYSVRKYKSSKYELELETEKVLVIVLCMGIYQEIQGILDLRSHFLC